MTQYDNTGKGALWSNTHWSEGDKGPKWTGSIVADRDIRMGEEIPLSVWKADRKSEKSPVMRLQVNRWKEQQATAAAPQQPKSDFDDSIPF